MSVEKEMIINDEWGFMSKYWGREKKLEPVKKGRQVGFQLSQGALTAKPNGLPFASYSPPPFYSF